MTAYEAGFTALLTPDGQVQELLVDHVGLSGASRLGDWVADSSSEKARAFIDLINDAGVAFGWELTVQVDDVDHVLSFSGGRTQSGHLMVVASSCETALEAMYIDLLRINDEQANMLRELSRTVVKGRQAPALMDEMMQLNNELTQLQRKLAKKTRQLERLNERKNEVLGMVAHDLRNPLGVIAGYARLMESGMTGELSERQADMVRRIGATSSQMRRIVDDLLDLSAIESGSLALEREDIDPLVLLEEALALAKPMASAKNITLDLEADGLPMVWVDVGKLRQVVDNLLSNAIKYSHPDSAVRIVAGANSTQLRIDVADQGQGIPEEELGSLFKVFGKTSVKSTAGEKSTGLGLAICKKIIEAHGGRIWAESEPGEGATFSFELPMGRSDAA